jgi:hypothetical protein
VSIIEGKISGAPLPVFAGKVHTAAFPEFLDKREGFL